MKKIFLAIMAIMFILANIKIVLPAATPDEKLPIGVTEIETVVIGGIKKQANIVLNNALRINEIEIIKKDNVKEKDIAFPVYITKNKKAIPQVVVLSKEAREIIKQAVFTNQPSSLGPTAINYKISQISFYPVRSNPDKSRDADAQAHRTSNGVYQPKDSPIKAFVKVVFNNAVQVETRVMTSKTGLWIAWPGRKSEQSKWIEQVVIIKKELKDNIEKAILNKYKVVESEEP